MAMKVTIHSTKYWSGRGVTLAPGNPAVIFDEPGCDLPGKVLGFLQQEGMELFREVENFSKVGGCTSASFW